MKTNNNKILNYLLSELETSELEGLYISKNSFKIYDNIIVHYNGNYNNIYTQLICDMLTNIVILFFESKLISRIINNNYFYFLDSEKNEITTLCLECSNSSPHMRELIYNSIFDYISKNKSIVLDGFVNFRLQEYAVELENIVDLCVNKFLIEREYIEFIQLLKLYVESRASEISIVHLVYHNATSMILDKEKSIIALDDNIFKAKYLSDITFSSNDYALNTLLTLLPENIYIHLIDVADEFINTLILVFGNRIKICTDCDICRSYRLVGVHDWTRAQSCAPTLISPIL